MQALEGRLKLGSRRLGLLFIQVHFRVGLSDQRFHGLASTPFGRSNGPVQLDHDQFFVSIVNGVFPKDPLLDAFNVSLCRVQLARENDEELIAAPPANEVT